MRKNKLSALVIIVVFIISSVISVSGDTASNSSCRNSIKDRQELIFNLYEDPYTLDFQACSSAIEAQIYNWIMEGLTRSAGNGKIKPGIAERWDISPDGKVWTFYLRDARWTDGKPVTAQDFAYGWFRALDPSETKDYSFLLSDILNADKYMEGSASAKDVGIKVIDDKTLKVILEHPISYLDYQVSFPIFAPVRQDIYEKYIDKYNTEAEYFITNGPFKLEMWKPETGMVFAKNPKYWDSKSIILERVTGIMVDEETELLLYQSGGVDILTHFNADNRSSIKKDEIRTVSDGSVWYINYNCSHPVLKNKNIRKALTYAIDRQYFITNVAARPWKPALAFIQPEIIPDAGGKTFREMVPAFFKDNDVETSKMLLAQGMKELGITKLPKIKFMANDTDAGKTYAQGIIQMWKKNLGIEVEIEPVRFVERIRRQRGHDFDISLMGWLPDYPDAMSMLDIFATDNVNNDGLYSNPQYDALIAAAKSELNGTKKSELMHKAEQLLMEDMPICPLYFGYKEYAIKGHVKNFQRGAFDPDDNLIYSYIEGRK